MELFVEIQKKTDLDKVFIILIFCLISSFIFSILDVFLFQKLFNTEINKKQKVLFIFIDSILKFLEVLFIHMSYYIFANFVLSIILLKIISNKELEKCILNQTISMLCTISAHIFISEILFKVLDNILDNQKIIYLFLVSVVAIIFKILIYYVVKIKNLNIGINQNLTKATRIKICCVTGIGALILFLNSIEVIKYIRDYPYVIFLFEYISMILFLYFILNNNFELARIEEQSLKIENLETYNKTLTMMYDNIRGFKHDYANFVQSLNGYIQTDNMNGIKKMCNSVFEECKNVNTLGFLDPDLINNPPIYSILTSKYYLAIENEVNVNLEILIDFEEIKDDIYELCKILAILFDNAIEAAKECDNKFINIRFLKDEFSNDKVIIIENSYKQDNIDIGKIFEKGFTTKQDNNNEHGLGLWTVRKILNKSKRLNLYTSNNDEVFCQKLVIYNK